MFYSKCYLMVSMILWSCFHFGQQIDSAQIKQIYNFSLTRSSCYENLRSLCKDVGHRLSGSPSAQKAVEWGYDLMSSMQLDSVYYNLLGFHNGLGVMLKKCIGKIKMETLKIQIVQL